MSTFLVRLAVLSLRPSALASELWKEDARCADAPDPDLWFPESSKPEAHRTLMAKYQCRQCPVQAECLAEGMDRDYGIYGGLTPAERLLLSEGRTA